MIALAPALVEVRREGETFYVASGHALGEVPATLGAVFRAAVGRAPDREMLVGRRADGSLRRVTYREALAAAEGVADWIVKELPSGARVMALSGNSVDHALVMLGCLLVGAAFVPVSPAYSLMSQDFAKLRVVAGKVRPAAVFVESEAPFRRALEVVRSGEGEGARVIVGGELDAIYTRRAGEEVASREARVGPDDVAKILFTSGSTGSPKGVPNTHRMLCSNQQMIAQLWPFLSEEPQVLVDWLPWSHTFGGNHNFNMVLFHAATLLVDEGKPTEALIGASLRNLRESPPTLYFNVPAGYAALVGHLERDEELRRAFFSRLRVMFYAAAALPADLWARLVELARGAVPEGREVFMTTAWGSTETSPLATSTHFHSEVAGNIGLPAPGVTLKIVPNGNKREVRVKGPNVMRGYFEEPELTAQAFDEEGFYKIGDAVRFARGLDDPTGGLLFDGRVAEDFKLSSGTWVSVTTIRTGVLAEAGGLFLDAVVAGQDREAITLLVWPSLAGAASLCPGAKTLAELAASEVVRGRVRDVLRAWNDRHGGASSMRIERALLLEEPPNIDAGEITDKGYINQRATLERRAREVARLYDTTDEQVIDATTRD